MNYQTPEFAEYFDELPLWSARFGIALLERVPLRPGQTILDAGAGSGFLSIELAQRCGETSRVIAVDPWRAAMQRLERKLAHAGLRNVQPIIQDLESAEIPANSVDLIVSNLGLNNFEAPAAALQACFRAARPGARLFLTTNLVGHMDEFYRAYETVLTELGYVDRLPYLAAHVQHRATVESVHHLLREAGFTTVATHTSIFRERYANGSALLRHAFIRVGFMPAWKAIVPAELVQPVFAALEQRLNLEADRQGELSLTIPMACIEAQKPEG
ncbi:MAG: methyltransferase domain-containing protein [Planctomycetes bacterium]|nr:methyltransferase domain-containing protein [Planctomycetota bacterium]